MAYELCKFQIESGNYNKEEMTGDLTAKQFMELSNMLNSKTSDIPIES